MISLCCRVSLLAMSAVLATGPAYAQSFEVLGSRPAGMGGAFVAVADDASAVYWNPAGLAAGAYFSLLVDYTNAEATDDEALRGGSRSGGVIAIAAPMVGLSYYRLRTTTVESAPGLPGVAASSQLQSLITHHAGATLVQSLTDRIAVGATLKLVRGIAASAVVPQVSVDDLLDEAVELVGAAENKFDADIGVIATVGSVRAGLTVRNVTEPEFDLPFDAGKLRLDRQVRAGVSLAPIEGLLVAADLDLQKVRSSIGEERNLAVGAEAHVLPRAFVRSGFRLNTVDDGVGRKPVVSLGGSYAAVGSLFVDGQITLGSEAGDRGWGVGARLVF